jgi:hypothetical protein
MMMRLTSVLILGLMLAGCTRTSGVMEGENGTYLISARAAPAAGGTAGANQAAYEEAQKFCATKGARAIVITSAERDTYQSFGSATANAYGGSASSSTSAAGNASIRFRCGV